MKTRKRTKFGLKVVSVFGDPVVMSRLYRALVNARWPYAELNRGEVWECKFIIDFF